MHLSITSTVDDISLRRTVKLLCETGVRAPLTMERIKIWLNQFKKGPETTLGLLIVRHLIYRTTTQIEAAMRPALKSAALHFVPESERMILDWREVLSGKYSSIRLYFGPPENEFTQPGKSGEGIVRMLKQKFQVPTSNLYYLSQGINLQDDERFLLVDDGSFTGDQILQIIAATNSESIAASGKMGLVVALAHDEAIKAIKQQFPQFPIFYGEKLSLEDGFTALAKQWVIDETWPYPDIDPIQTYMDVVHAHGPFNSIQPFGLKSLGLLVAYEHGAPDDSLQLLWASSANWAPLFQR